jgi:N-acetylglucosaminyl-diphospho-decaprenol L-rhamnosyltransferase
MSVDVAVLIVSYNTRERTLDCVRSVLAHPPAPATEIVVVDNDSADGSADALELEFPDVTVLRSGDNLGFARAVNLGARATGAEYLLLLNPDTVVRTGALAALLDFARTHPEHGVYGGRTFREDGELDPSSCWGAPTLWSLTCFALGLSTAFAGSAVFDPESLGRWRRDTVREVPVVTGCLLLVSRADFFSIGGMDERFFLYGEDAEFSLRAGRAGMRPVIVPEAAIVHAVGASTGARGRKMTMVLAGKVTLLRSAWAPMRARLGVGMLATGVLLRAGLETLARRSDRMWAHAWRHRADWLPGYPEARELIFGKATSHA